MSYIFVYFPIFQIASTKESIDKIRHHIWFLNRNKTFFLVQIPLGILSFTPGCHAQKIEKVKYLKIEKGQNIKENLFKIF